MRHDCLDALVPVSSMGSCSTFRETRRSIGIGTDIKKLVF